MQQTHKRSRLPGNPPGPSLEHSWTHHWGCVEVRREQQRLLIPLAAAGAGAVACKLAAAAAAATAAAEGVVQGLPAAARGGGIPLARLQRAWVGWDREGQVGQRVAASGGAEEQLQGSRAAQLGSANTDTRRSLAGGQPRGCMASRPACMHGSAQTARHESAAAGTAVLPQGAGGAPTSASSGPICARHTTAVTLPCRLGSLLGRCREQEGGCGATWSACALWAGGRRPAGSDSDTPHNTGCCSSGGRGSWAGRIGAMEAGPHLPVLWGWTALAATHTVDASVAMAWGRLGRGLGRGWERSGACGCLPGAACRARRLHSVGTIGRRQREPPATPSPRLSSHSRQLHGSRGDLQAIPFTSRPHQV